MKFFSFSKEDIHIAPSKKIIDSESFTKVLEISEILEMAKQEAFEIKEKAIIDANIIKEEAKKEGFDEGLVNINEHILNIDKKLEEISSEYEKKVLPIALKAAKKIISEELKLHPERILDIVKATLKPIVQHHYIKIYVSKKDFVYLEKEKKHILDMLSQVKTFSIEERDDITDGGCIIETESGIINAQLENQFRALEAAFEKFMKK